MPLIPPALPPLGRHTSRHHKPDALVAIGGGIGTGAVTIASEMRLHERQTCHHDA